jgi:uncharacterized protein (TIGR03083 family)
MSEQAIGGLRTEIDAVRELGRSLTPEEWELPSACYGWSVKDVFSHMACLWHGLVEPEVSPLPEFKDVEAENEVFVEKRRSWHTKEILDEYEEFCDGALEALRSFQSPEMRDAPFPAGTLGTYPIHVVANALMFDHLAHLRFDLLHPFGPIQRPRPAPNEDGLRPAVEWLIAGTTQMLPARDEIYAALAKPVLLDLTGPGGGRWLLRKSDDKAGMVTEENPSPSDAGACAVGSAESFIGWGTKRWDWRRSGVRVTGDTAVASAVLDAINVI